MVRQKPAKLLPPVRIWVSPFLYNSRFSRGEDCSLIKSNYGRLALCRAKQSSELFCERGSAAEGNYRFPIKSNYGRLALCRAKQSGELFRERGSAAEGNYRFPIKLNYGRLAQLVAHHIDIVGVTCSSHVSPTIKEIRFLISFMV